MKTLRYFLLIAILSSLIFFNRDQLSTAYACSGYPYFGVENLPEAEVLVKATVLETDERGYSAVMRVEEYYKGSGNRLLTVMRYPVSLTTGALVRGYDTSCLYAGQGQRLHRGSQGYFGLASNGDGTFTDYISGTAHFYPVDGKIYYQEGATEGYAVEMDDELVIAEKDFIGKMLEAGGRKTAVQPSADTQFYPLKRFLNLTTKNGTRYQINPDRSLSKLPADAPIAMSPDGAHLAFKVDDQTIGFQYIWTKYQYNEEYAEQTQEMLDQLQVKGQAVAFSSDNNLVAVWDTSKLTIYMIANGDAFAGYGSAMTMTKVAERSLTTNKTIPLPTVMWSANGSTLAWQDASGVWRWNIFDEAAPTQIIKDKTALIDISTYGRFVRVGTWESWRLLDTLTGKEYPSTIASPNELYLISINREYQNLDREQADVSGCTPPLRTNCTTVLADSNYADIYPLQMELLGTAACDQDKNCRLATYSWHPAIGDTDWLGGRYFNAFIYDFRAVQYDMQYQQPALLVGDYNLYFDFYSTEDVETKEYRPYLDILELKGKVDSPIVSIEWGSSVFYDPYLLSSLEYHP